MKSLKEKATLTTVAKINNVEIIVIENGEKRVAIRPICQALGIAFEPQFTKLKSDPILSSTVMMSVTVGADEKQREMVTIPYMFVFGWLFRIDSRKVKPKAKESVEHYQLECYHALYNHFTQHADYVEWQSTLVEEQHLVVEGINRDFSEAKNRLLEAKKELQRRRNLTMADYHDHCAQLKAFTNEEMEG